MLFKKSFIYCLFAMIVLAIANLPSMAGVPVVNLSDSNGLKNVNASIVIDAPTNVVWKVLTDYNHFTSYMPGIKQFSIIKNSGNNKVANIKLDVSAFMSAFSYQAHIVENMVAKTVMMTRTSGDFNSLKVSYSIKPVDNGTKTMLTYNLKVDHGKNVPESFANKALKTNAYKTLQAVDTVSVKKYSSQKIAHN